MIESLQTRDRFVLRYLEAISPNKANGKAYESTRICKSLADKIGLTPGKDLPLDSFVPKIIEELKAVEQDVLTGINIKPGVDTVYYLQHSLGTFATITNLLLPIGLKTMEVFGSLPSLVYSSQSVCFVEITTTSNRLLVFFQIVLSPR